MEHEIEVKYWVKHFSISIDDLQRTIEKVGNSASAVRKELRDAQARKNNKNNQRLPQVGTERRVSRSMFGLPQKCSGRQRPALDR
jgi:hypothetical protein